METEDSGPRRHTTHFELREATSVSTFTPCEGKKLLYYTEILNVIHVTSINVT